MRLAQMNNGEMLSNLIENALDFLVRAIAELETAPKFSIIHFYTSIELFMKARLLHEHWSLVVLRDPDRKKFESGDFHSVSFEAACERLLKVVQSPIGERALKNFDAVRKHRNKMVHFFHEVQSTSNETVKQIAQEQLRAWAGLHQLVTSQWSQVFEEYAERFDEIERSLKHHREYLRAKYEEISPAIDAERKIGATYVRCASCRFDAARAQQIIGDLHEATCKVCGYECRYFSYKCSACEKMSPLFEGGRFVCEHCECENGDEAIFDQINQYVTTPDNYFEARVPANCGECGGYHTVAEYEDQYLCVVCLDISEDLQFCGWCGAANTGDMTDSTWSGCSECEGQAGHIASKND